MKVILSICLLFLANFSLLAQEGGYFLTHYSSVNPEINNVNFDITQNHQGVICIANRSGIIQFDGKNWDKINTPSAIFSLALGSENTLYTGGINGFGKISRGEENYLQYESLTDSSASNIFDILTFENKLYGINQSTVFVYDIQANTLSTIPSVYSGELLKIVLIENEVYVNTDISGLKMISDGALLSPQNPALENEHIEFVSGRGNNGNYIVGLTNNELYTLSSESFTPLDIESEYLNESIIIDGTWVNDSLVAIGTLKGGVIFINPLTKKVTQIVNYQSGLPDNEILAMALDSHNGLWIAHKEGFTRISPEFPFRDFNRYPGLSGDLLSVQFHDDRLYVGTTLGLYYLEEVREYEEKTTVEKRIVKTRVPVEQQNSSGLFGFLKRNKKEETTKIRTRTRYISRIEKELQSIRYEYKKVSTLSSKVLHLSSLGSRLFSGGLDGLYEIQDSVATQITASPVRSFYASPGYQKVFINTYNDKFEVYDLSTPDYEKINILPDFHDWVTYIFEDTKGRVWFCSSNDLYWLKLNQNEIVDSDEYAIENPFYYDTYGISFKDSVHFVNESGVYRLDEQSNHLIKSKYPAQTKYLKDNNGTVWLLQNEKWKTLGSNFASSQLDILSLFTDINHISYDEQKQNFWVLTNGGNLYKLRPNENISRSLAGYDLFLKNIRTTSKIFLPEPGLKFEQQNGALTFEFVQPEYSGVLNIEYQYMLQGLSNTWSEWSSSHDVIPIPYLPDGEYKLKMRSKNIVTGVKEISPISFEIIPPYWKRPWFLAFEFSALAMLLFLSVRLKKLGYKYRMMSRLLALLTLIIIIEFIQTVAENEFGTQTSPVFDFMIQITVAVIILPVEGLIRKYIFKEENVQILDFISLKNKNEKV